ncbi:hypothetical protein OIE66_34430 [Nonomuraea sp. NBC_01738]|uniref:hypothetical protein n=1 Tax=Nonomuraea sp. NBC_01738 TaxID=2976003 RepID=UPI002E150169|nr:hypothetical protein OIE66_34430 [Nonomuraea sp. NBC_01738]
MSKFDVARLREPAAWVMLAVGATDILVSVGRFLISADNSVYGPGYNLADRGGAQFFSLTSPFTTALLVGAVLLVTKVGQPAKQAKPIMMAAGITLAAAALFGVLSFFVGLFGFEDVRSGGEFFLTGLPQLALTAIALVYVGVQVIPDRVAAQYIPPAFQGYGQQPQQFTGQNFAQPPQPAYGQSPFAQQPGAGPDFGQQSQQSQQSQQQGFQQGQQPPQQQDFGQQDFQQQGFQQQPYAQPQPPQQQPEPPVQPVQPVQAALPALPAAPEPAAPQYSEPAPQYNEQPASQYNEPTPYPEPQQYGFAPAPEPAQNTYGQDPQQQYAGGYTGTDPQAPYPAEAPPTTPYVAQPQQPEPYQQGNAYTPSETLPDAGYQPAPYLPADSTPNVYQQNAYTPQPDSQVANPYAPPPTYAPQENYTPQDGSTSPSVPYPPQPDQQQAYYERPPAFEQGGQPFTGYSGQEFAQQQYQEPDPPVDPRSQQLLDAYQQAETYQHSTPGQPYDDPFGHPQAHAQAQQQSQPPAPQQQQQPPAPQQQPYAQQQPYQQPQPGYQPQPQDSPAESTVRLDPTMFRGDALNDPPRQGDDPIDPTAIYTPNEPRG